MFRVILLIIKLIIITKDYKRQFIIIFNRFEIRNQKFKNKHILIENNISKHLFKINRRKGINKF